MEKRKIVLFISSSLDGYIATEDHDLDWLFAVEGDGDNGFNKFYETIDTVLIGKITYDWIMEHEKGNFPYKNKECYVFSNEKRSNTEYVKFKQNISKEFINELKRKDGKNIWIVGGGKLINTLLNEKLIDEIIVTIAPVLIGKGIPLFPFNDNKTLLKLNCINRYNQFIELNYNVIHN